MHRIAANVLVERGFGYVASLLELHGSLHLAGRSRLCRSLLRESQTLFGGRYCSRCGYLRISGRQLSCCVARPTTRESLTDPLDIEDVFSAQIKDQHAMSAGVHARLGSLLRDLQGAEVQSESTFLQLADASLVVNISAI